MDSETHLRMVETLLDEQKKCNEETRETLSNIFKSIERIKPQSPPENRESLARSSTDSFFDEPRNTPKESRIRPSAPMDFDGNRSKGHTFINQCELYMSLRKPDFPDHSVRITWTLTFMKSGRAATFAEHTLAYKAKHREDRFDTWAEFVSSFSEAFFPLNEDVNAIIRLESEAYYQGRRSVDEYLDEFEELLDMAGYTDPLTYVIKFRKGLNPTIQDQIATSREGRPADDDFRTWCKAARTVDQN